MREFRYAPHQTFTPVRANNLLMDSRRLSLGVSHPSLTGTCHLVMQEKEVKCPVVDIMSPIPCRHFVECRQNILQEGEGVQKNRNY